MPQSRNRPGHPHQKDSPVPASQRVRGRVLWAILLAIFGGLIAFFAVGNNLVVIAVVAVVSAVIGYIAGRVMEKQ